MQIIPIASGKGGVGKSLVAANLAIALGKAGKDVVIADLDIGAANLHLALGLQIPKAGFGDFLRGTVSLQDIIVPTDFKRVRFIAGDAETPGLTSIPYAKRMTLLKELQNIECDYLILDLGAGTHLPILDLFLLSPHGILVTAPTVTATLNAYLFLKNAVFRLMYNSFPKNSAGYAFLEELKSKQKEMQQLYVPQIVKTLMELDAENTETFISHIKMFKPRLIMNMIEDPKTSDRALKIRKSCQDYLELDLDYLGIIFRDPMQDIALASRLPITLYKPQSVLSQSIFRIAEKIIDTKQEGFTGLNQDSFNTIEEDVESDYAAKLSYIEDLIGSGTLTTADLSDVIKSQQYEITQLKNANNLLKSKIRKAHEQGYIL